MTGPKGGQGRRDGALKPSRAISSSRLVVDYLVSKA
jgi:hypothetical protein